MKYISCISSIIACNITNLSNKFSLSLRALAHPKLVKHKSYISGSNIDEIIDFYLCTSECYTQVYKNINTLSDISQ